MSGGTRTRGRRRSQRIRARHESHGAHPALTRAGSRAGLPKSADGPAKHYGGSQCQHRDSSSHTRKSGCRDTDALCWFLQPPGHGRTPRDCARCKRHAALSPIQSLDPSDPERTATGSARRYVVNLPHQSHDFAGAHRADNHGGGGSGAEEGRGASRRSWSGKQHTKKGDYTAPRGRSAPPTHHRHPPIHRDNRVLASWRVVGVTDVDLKRCRF